MRGRPTRSALPKNHDPLSLDRSAGDAQPREVNPGRHPLPRISDTVPDRRLWEVLAHTGVYSPGMMYRATSMCGLPRPDQRARADPFGGDGPHHVHANRRLPASFILTIPHEVHAASPNGRARNAPNQPAGRIQDIHRRDRDRLEAETDRHYAKGGVRREDEPGSSDGGRRNRGERTRLRYTDNSDRGSGISIAARRLALIEGTATIAQPEHFGCCVQSLGS